MHFQAPAGSPAIQNGSRRDIRSRGLLRRLPLCSRSFHPLIVPLLAALALVFPAAPRRTFAANDSFYHVVEVKPNVFVWVAEDVLNQEGDPEFNRAGNAGFIVTNDGVVVVNTTNSPFNARALLYEIRKRTDQPVRYVIDTSASPDVMLGNEAFEYFRPVIISTRQAAQEMADYKKAFPARVENDWKIAAKMRGVHPLPANQIFDKELTLYVGGQDIRVIDMGDNTSPGDAAVYLPGSKVLFLGNIFENEYVPRIGIANMEQWIATLRKVESWDADVYVPGHGQPAGKAQVQSFSGFLEWLYGRVRSGYQQGKSLAQIQGQIVPFQNIHWHAPELESEAVAGVYRSLAKNSSQSSSSTSPPSP
ncbi:MAG TPA: MBL fold metallo-hydrolase [Terriglobia bacterium]|nr:MBL fold metallo-hydrolase [Terriglobia bacterium]